MKIYALLSWYDEDPKHLRRCVTSLKGFADVLVAVDGAYETFPDAQPESPSVQQWALSDATRVAGLRPFLMMGAVWKSEVAKRAQMFEFARHFGATPDDWFLIIDADMSLGEFSPEARGKLEASDCDVAEVKWHDVMVNGMPCSTNRFRSLFRALPGLTVERAHYLYTVPKTDFCSCDSECPECYGFRAIDSPRLRRFLWHLPNGHPSDEPTLDLFGDVTLHHFNSQRDPGRKHRALEYYRDRDARTLESKGDWI